MDTQRQIDDLKKEIDSLTKQINDLSVSVELHKTSYQQHRHNNVDGTQTINNLELPRGEFLKIGDTAITGYTNTSSSVEDENFVISTGPDSSGFKQNSLSSDFNINHYGSTNGSTNQTFINSLRPPIYTNTNKSVTSGASTLSDSSFTWATNELSGAIINIFDSSGTFQFSRQIASNTSTQITIDGTWPSTVNSCQYVVFMPVYLGAANIPWRQGYFGGDDVSSGGTGAQRRAIRFGYGTTGGTETIGVFFGTGSPESVVTANVGSLFLRTDGGATTTLYVKTSGTSNTGWTAK